MYTPLYCAILNKHTDAVRLLVELGAESNDDVWVGVFIYHKGNVDIKRILEIKDDPASRPITYRGDLMRELLSYNVVIERCYSTYMFDTELPLIYCKWSSSDDIG